MLKDVRNFPATLHASALAIVAMTFDKEYAIDPQSCAAPPKQENCEIWCFCAKNTSDKKLWCRKKSNVGNRLKRILAKFEADRRHPRRDERRASRFDRRRG